MEQVKWHVWPLNSESQCLSAPISPAHKTHWFSDLDVMGTSSCCRSLGLWSPMEAYTTHSSESASTVVLPLYRWESLHWAGGSWLNCISASPVCLNVAFSLHPCSSSLQAILRDCCPCAFILMCLWLELSSGSSYSAILIHNLLNIHFFHHISFFDYDPPASLLSGPLY